MKFGLLTNATVVNDAIRFVSHSKESKEPLVAYQLALKNYGFGGGEDYKNK